MSFAAIFVAGLVFLALPGQASAEWACRLECTAAKRGITSFECPGTPTEAVCGPGPGYTCYMGANDPCPDNYMMHCAQANCPVSCNTADYPCAGCTAPTSTVGQACSPPTNGVFKDRCSTCDCPTDKVKCATSDPQKCVTPLTCPPGMIFDACLEVCVAPYILASPTPPQPVPQDAFFSITGDMRSSGGDIFLNDGKAVRVDSLGGNGIAELNFGNWGAGSAGPFRSRVFGDLITDGRLGIGIPDPSYAGWIGYPLDIQSGDTTAVVNINDKAGDKWTGLRLGRGAGNAEKWFIGMDNGTDKLLFRRTGSTNDITIDAGGVLVNNTLAVFSPTAGILMRHTEGEIAINEIDVQNPSGTGTVAAIGNYASYFLTNVGIGTNNPLSRLEVNGTAQVTGFKMPTGAQPGYVLTSDTNGVGTWQAGIGSIDECAAGKYHHVSTETYNGAGIGGYTSAAAKCQLGGSANADTHLCSTEEILRTLVCAPSSLPTAGSGWLNNGPPGFTSPASNDCAGWTSGAQTAYGDFWQFDANGGKGFATGCNSTLPIICCKKK